MSAAAGLFQVCDATVSIQLRHLRLNVTLVIRATRHEHRLFSEGSSALLGGLDEKQQMLLDAVEFASRERPQLTGRVTIALDLRDDYTTPNHQHRQSLIA